jgi:hypothetical protein
MSATEQSVAPEPFSDRYVGSLCPESRQDSVEGAMERRLPTKCRENATTFALEPGANAFR